MGLLAGALTVASSVVKGVSALKAGNANYAAGMEAAREREALGAEEERRIREEARAAIGDQFEALGSGGFVANTGTGLDALRESQLQTALDVLTVRRSRGSEARSLREQARNARREGRFALAGEIIGGITSGLKMKNDWAQARAPGTSGGDGDGRRAGDYGYGPGHRPSIEGFPQGG